MKILVSVLVNACILFGIAYFLPYDTVSGTGVIATGGWQLYMAGGIVLGLLNLLVRPILNIIGFPFVILTFGLFILVINGIILLLLEKAIQAIGIDGTYDIKGAVIFVIAVAIFTLFNTIANVLVKK
ncbi:MAG: phage holin family protein [Candidatus Gracilibacteria bacterium]|nr:phage holin family protein [Candidatus Gracilibacteria bacterium]